MTEINNNLDYVIEEIKCGVADDGNVVCQMKYNDGNKSHYLSLFDLDGLPEFHEVDKDVYEDMLVADSDNDKFWDYMDDTYIDEFNGIKLTDYEEMIDSFATAKPNDVKLIRAIVYATRCAFEELEPFIKLITNKHVSEIEVPMFDIEEDLLDDEEY